MNMNNRNSNRNSTRNRLFHWSQSLNLDPHNPHENFNISPSNSQSLTNSQATEGTKQKQNISSVFTIVTVPFIELTQIKFLNLLFLNLTLNSINTILFQYISYEEGRFLMLGQQVGAIVGETHDITRYKNIFEHYKEMLQLLIDRYHLVEPDFITIRFKTLHIEANLQISKQNLSSIELHKGLVKVERMKTNFNSKILPYTYKEKYKNLRQDYITDLIALLEKNNLNVTTRTEYQKYIPIESANNEKE